MNIKIRAWSKVENTMLSWSLIRQSAIPELIYKILVSDKDSFIPMLYLGLSDKKGNEICDGDILRHPESNLFDWIVEFKDGCFCVVNIGVDGLLQDRFQVDSTTFTDRVIIGNKFDNPELMKP